MKSQVEIIEETIRYIDALHHQLAARLHSQNVNSTSDETHNEPKREGIYTHLHTYIHTYL